MLLLFLSLLLFLFLMVSIFDVVGRRLYYIVLLLAPVDVVWLFLLLRARYSLERY